MSRTSEWHEKLTDGVGKCSVPMWMGGVPAGFCDKPAYGKQEKDQYRYGNWYDRGSYREWIAGYCGGLACYGHGGPKEKP
jgi:hypothetical protein